MECSVELFTLIFPNVFALGSLLNYISLTFPTGQA